MPVSECVCDLEPIGRGGGLRMLLGLDVQKRDLDLDLDLDLEEMEES
jgi:hypothetical protein